jgi:hypothetical protein
MDGHATARANVRVGSKAVLPAQKSDFRFTPVSRHPDASGHAEEIARHTEDPRMRHGLRDRPGAAGGQWLQHAIGTRLRGRSDELVALQGGLG